MLIGLIGISIYISIMDIKFHRISNRSLVFATFVLLVLEILQDVSLNPMSALVAAVISPILLQVGVGAGDLKLFILLAYFFLPCTLSNWVKFLSAFIVISVVLILITALKERTLQSSIALAPAICGAVIWCAR